MVNLCCAFNCRNNSKYNKKISFFSIPTDAVRQLQWLEKIGRLDLMAENPDYVHTKRVCSEHFEESMFAGFSFTKNKLKPLAIPTLFQEGVGYKGVNVGASTSASSSTTTSQELKEKENILPTCSVLTEVHLENQGEDSRIQKMRAEVPNLKRKIARISQPSERKTAKTVQSSITKEEFIEFCQNTFSTGLAKFIAIQMELPSKKPSAHRYPHELKQFALTIYFLGPKVYRFLSKTFKLPHKATLCRMTSKWNITAGINPNIFQIIYIKMQNIDSKYRDCILCADEMTLKTHLFYNRSKDYIIGFHQNFDSRIYVPANSVLTIMARGLTKNWKQPIAYFYIHNSCEVMYLKQIILKMVEELNKVNLRVRAVVTDQGSNFVRFFKELGGSVEKPYFFVNDLKVYHIFDPPHLLKSTRNNFYEYKFKYGPNFIEKKYLELLYDYDKSRSLNRLAPKLTDIHLQPNSFQKMRVFLAAQVFSRTVATAMETLLSFNYIASSAITTISFVNDIDSLFDIFNSSTFRDPKILRRPFTGTDIQLAHLRKMKDFFINLKVFKNEIDVTNRIKCFKGWITTINSFLLLWDDIKDDTKFICTRHINQDALENMFGTLRAQGGNSVNPTPVQFYNCFRKLFSLDYFQHVEGANCIEDLDELLLQFSKYDSSFLRRYFGDFENDDESLELQKCNEIANIQTEEYSKLSLPEKNALTYVCGYLIKKCLDKHSCDVCDNFSKHQKDLSNHLILTHFRRYENTEETTFGNLRTNYFYVYISTLDSAFCSMFPKLAMLANAGLNIKLTLEEIDFRHPCPMFPKQYLLALYTRFRIFYTLKFANRNFSVKSGNKKQQKLINISHL